MPRASQEKRAKAAPPTCPKCKLQKVKVERECSSSRVLGKVFVTCLQKGCGHRWQICGTYIPKKNKLCEIRDTKLLGDNGRCNLHGKKGGAPVTTGTASKFYLPKKFQEDAAAFLSDPALAGLREEMALKKARMNALRREADTCTDPAQEKAIWEEHDLLEEDLRKSATVETRREALAAATMSAREVAAWRAGMFVAMNEVISELVGKFQGFASELARQYPDIPRLDVREGPIRAMVWHRFAARISRADEGPPALESGG